MNSNKLQIARFENDEVVEIISNIPKIDIYQTYL